jgi:hypothetical protein
MPQRESRLVLLVARACIALVCVHVAFSCWSLYRRIRQVLRVDVRVSSTALGPGATVSYDVVTSGEVSNRILLELVQGARAETLFVERGRVNAVNTYDPRVFRSVARCPSRRSCSPDSRPGRRPSVSPASAVRSSCARPHPG